MTYHRRDFLKGTIGASGLLPLLPGFFSLLSPPRRGDPDERVLVVLQLSGGNDGLNTVVPYDDEAYLRHRPTLRQSKRDVHRFAPGLGFHPRMKAFRELYDAGTLAVVQGVGYANPDGDHDGSMRIWHRADPERTGRRTGWLGRYADLVREPETIDLPTLFVGRIAAPGALRARRALVPSVTSARELARDVTDDSSATTRLPAPVATPEDPLALLLHDVAGRAHAARRRIATVVRDDSDPFPASPLAADLRTVVQLVRAELGVRVYFVEIGGGGIGGFDNHANQRDNHGSLLEQLSTSVAAFLRALERSGHLDRVLLATFSEFGRTLAENGRQGTGHGNAAPLFLAGGAVRRGLHGEAPRLAGLDGGALPPTIDFRRVYATLLEKWLERESEPILGARFPPLDLLGG